MKALGSKQSLDGSRNAFRLSDTLGDRRIYCFRRGQKYQSSLIGDASITVA
jgi:hypothetical protein